MLLVDMRKQVTIISKEVTRLFQAATQSSLSWGGMNMVEVVMKHGGITESLCGKTIGGRAAKAISVYVEIEAMVYLQMVQWIGVDSLWAALCLNGASEYHLRINMIFMQMREPIFVRLKRHITSVPGTLKH